MAKMSRNHRYARIYARQGIPVLPLWPIVNGKCGCGNADISGGHRPGKHPIGSLVRNGLLDATRDLAQVDQWWGKFPNANIAGVTGPSGFVVYDVDIKSGGVESWLNLLAKHNYGKPFNTVTARTGSGGQHIFMRHPGTGQLTKIGFVKGVDLLADGRGSGSYVVLPPSNHISGGIYEWVQNEALAKRRKGFMPFVDLVPKDPKKKNEPKYKQHEIRTGEWNNAITSAAGRLVEVAGTPDELFDQLVVWNEHHSAPGFATMKQGDFDFVRDLAHRAFVGWKENGTLLGTPYRIDDIEDVINDDIPPRPPDLIEDLVPVDASHIELLGPRGKGKTMVVLIMAIQGSIGRKVFGLKKVARPLRILFVEDETAKGVMRRREAAIVKYMKLTEDEKQLLRENFLPLRQPGFAFSDVENLRASLQVQLDADRPVDLIIVDSRTTSWPGAANDDEIATKIYTQRLKPIVKEYGSRFMLISHPPKQELDALGRAIPLTIAGTGVHERNADLLIGFRRWMEKPPQIKLEWIKMRDGEKTIEDSEIYAAVVEPIEQVPDPDEMTIELKPRGWVDLQKLDPMNGPLVQPTDTKTPMERAADELLDHINRDGGKTATQILKHVHDALGIGDSSIEKGIKYAKDNNWIEGGGRGTRAPFTITQSGKQHLDDLAQILAHAVQNSNGTVAPHF